MKRFVPDRYRKLKWISLGLTPLGLLMLVTGREGTVLFYLGIGVLGLAVTANLVNRYQSRHFASLCSSLERQLAILVLSGALVVYLRWFA